MSEEDAEKRVNGSRSERKVKDRMWIGVAAERRWILVVGSGMMKMMKSRHRRRSNISRSAKTDVCTLMLGIAGRMQVKFGIGTLLLLDGDSSRSRETGADRLEGKAALGWERIKWDADPRS